MHTEKIDFFFNPKSIILFGISRSEEKSGGLILPNIKVYNPKNAVIIHPKADNIKQIPCFMTIEDIPQDFRNSFDLAIIALPVKYVKEAIIDCIKHRVKGILIESGNIGNDSEEINANRIEIMNSINMYEKINGFKTRIIGPNSLGVFNNYNKFFTGIMKLEKYPPLTNNNFAIIAQTGLVVSGYLIDLFERSDIPVSYITAIGNKIDIDECDILEYLIEDEKTKSIGMYLEGIKDGKRFFNLCKQAIFTKNKRIILLKSGKSEIGAKAILSHTSSIAGNSKIQDAVCKQLGIIHVEDFSELLLAGKLSTNLPLPLGNRAGLISISGAGCVLSADLSEKYGFKVQKLTKDMIMRLKPIFPDWADISHPLDVWASIERVGADNTYNTSIETFITSGMFDFILFCTIAGIRAKFDYKFLKSLRKKYPKIPMYLQVFGGWSEIKSEFSSEFEDLKNHKKENEKEVNTYIPVVYDLKKTMEIISQLIYLSKKLGNSK